MDCDTVATYVHMAARINQVCVYVCDPKCVHMCVCVCVVKDWNLLRAVKVALASKTSLPVVISLDTV